ncbi:hypothetical protein KJ644_04315 [Candidatus Dependentiae bacterium]|nr:hypothetical protein [Candidatus Dependentiae bacterium]MBU4387663.1 hypothetical protein [Candidatus Dependentiae bacterium]MCG2756050.1 hypothetical protein [Candidatus Dependentiae bacterium]
MKQPLWILNSSLLIIFIFSVLLNLFLKQDVPVLRMPTAKTEEKKIDKKLEPEHIYQFDIFDTYSQTSIPEPVKKELITPIPEYIPHQIIPIPEPEKQTFVDTLNLKLSGIIATENEEKSAAMILDESNREKVYHLGDMVKDGQIIKISKNKIILLRVNGQQEAYLLRPEGIYQKVVPEKWNNIINKTNATNFIVDPKLFAENIGSLGQAMEKFSMLPAYENGKIIGIRIGKIENEELLNNLGVLKDDIILNINGITTANEKDRIKAFDKILDSKIGDLIKINLNRNGDLVTLNYNLQKIEKPKKIFFIDPAQAPVEPTKPETELKMSPDQEREAQLRKFEEEHKTPKQEDIISEIRKRILESMQSRSQERRIR